MEKITISKAQLTRALHRFEKSVHKKSHKIGAKFESTEYTFHGIDNSGKRFILRKCNDYYTQDIDKPTIKKDGKLKINLIQIADLKYDESIFRPMKTGDPIDYMFSSDGGIFPATNYMVIGDPGIGKSTQTLDLLAKIKRFDSKKKVLFISGEMNQIDMYGYVKRYPAFGRIPTLFLCDYLDENPAKVLEETFQQGWDLVLIDSFIEVQESIQAATNMTRTAAEKWMIDLMVTNNKGTNREKRYTSFLAIQQVTKGGNFVGSNKLKHNTTGMIELRYSSEFSGDRYAKVTKNRRGFQYEKIFFSLDGTESVTYDEKRLKRDEDIRQRLQKEKEILLSEEEKFNQIFGIKSESLEEEMM
jgi:predicted ATP-dependent serine protease